MEKKFFSTAINIFCVLSMVLLFPLNAFSEAERKGNVSERPEVETPEIVFERNKNLISDKDVKAEGAETKTAQKKSDMSAIHRRNLDLQQSKMEMSRELRTLGNDLRFSYNRPDSLKDIKDSSKDNH